jgi:DNA-binding XRE family transcriptional regulator
MEAPMPGPGRPRIELKFPERILTRYTAGEIDHHDVARLFRVSPRVALRELRGAGMDTSRSTRKRLSRTRQYDLAELYTSIRTLYSLGLSLREVGRQFDLTPEGVRQVLLRESVKLRPRGNRVPRSNRGPDRAEDFAERLRSARVQAGLSQAELAACSNVSRQTISGLERGARQPSEETLARLTEALKTHGRGADDSPAGWFTPRPEAEAS